MRVSLFIFLAIILSGCASTGTGIVQMGPDTYMVSRQGGYGQMSTGPLKAESIREASEFCTANQKEFEIVHTQELPSGFGRHPEAEIQFMCLNPGDPQLSRPKMRADPTQTIEVRMPSSR